MKKPSNIIVICIVGLLITFSSTAVVGISEINEKNKDIISFEVKHQVTNSHTFIKKGEYLSGVVKPVAKPLADVPLASTEDDEIHPSIAKGAGQFFAGYSNKISILEQNIYLVKSTDGNSWEDGIYLEMDGVQDYLDLDHWGGNTFYGTMNPGEDGLQYLLEIPDINDLANIGLIYWTWSDDGWYDMKDYQISCSDSQNTWEYGMMSTVASTTYGEENGWDGENMPHIFFRDPEEEGTGYISWNTYQGCGTSDCYIDRGENMMYAAYDYYNENTSSWDIMIWKRSFDDPLEGSSSFIIIETDFNVHYPTISADNGNIIVVYHSDENTNTDLVCFYSSDSGETWESTYIANSPDDEQFADIISTGSGNAGCVFTTGGDIYYTSTNDGGASWTNPTKLNEGGNNVVEEYRTTSIGLGGTVWTDTRNGNPDIFFDITGTFAEVNVKSISGGFGVSMEVENTGTATASDVQWSINLEGGLILVGQSAEGTISSLPAGGSTTVKIPLVLGFGGVTILGAADGSSKVASGTVLLFLVTGLA